MNLFHDFTGRIGAAIRRVLASDFAGREADLSRVVVEPPRDVGHGELSTNAAMVLAKPLGARPRDLAEAIARELRLDSDIAAVEVAGPGFINLTLNAGYWRAILVGILQAGDAFGRGAQRG